MSSIIQNMFDYLINFLVFRMIFFLIFLLVTGRANASVQYCHIQAYINTIIIIIM